MTLFFNLSYVSYAYARSFVVSVCCCGLMVLTGLFVLSGCDVQQDPLSDQPEAIRKATIKPVEAPKKVNFFGKEALFIDVKDSFILLEGEESTLKVGSRVVFKDSSMIDFSSKIHFENLPEGATYNKKKGVLRWKPAKGFVKVGLFEAGQFKVFLVVSTDKGKLSTHTAVSYMVQKRPEPLEVVAIKGLEDPLAEGERDKEFFVHVKDRDMGLIPPVLSLYISRESSSYSYIEELLPNWAFNLKSVEFLDAEGVYKYHYSIQEVPEVKDMERAYLFVRAISSYGLASSLYTGEVKLTETPGEPSLSWPKKFPLRVFQGQGGSFSFFVTDPQDEGKVELEFITNCSRLSPGSHCACISHGYGSASNGYGYGYGYGGEYGSGYNSTSNEEKGLFCTVEYNAPVYGMDKEIHIEFRVRNKISDNNVTPWREEKRSIFAVSTRGFPPSQQPQQQPQLQEPPAEESKREVEEEEIEPAF